MKIAYFGYNSFSSCLPIFAKHGHTIDVIFTGNDHLYADQIINFAQQNNIPLIFDKPDQQQLCNVVNAGVECVFSAEYPWLIPLPQSLTYAINVHPTMLPFGRGPTPVSYFLLNSVGYSGVTFHKMSDTFDEGDILLQEPITLDALESYDSFTTKLFIKAPLLLDKLLSNLDTYYKNALPQGTGSFWPSLSKEKQTVNWFQCVDEILKQSRAFGHLGVYSTINSQPVLITAASGCLFEHTIKPGTVISNDQIQLAVAVTDGFIYVAKNALFFIEKSKKT